ncbi:MAG TPA: phytanoyl-CoA dioxygenase family protein [Candidatus Kapabacteria bacterium]|nr:phytanoyl-CoA dioxygenase family protein [Candidatus Kapabacteria bacterium]
MPTKTVPKPGTITQKDIEFYQKNGFVRIKNLLTKAETEKLRVAVDHAVDVMTNHDTRPTSQRTKREKIFTQCQNLWEGFPDVKVFVFNKRLARAAAKLMQAKHVRIWHDNTLYKEPGGTRTPWHVDQAYWPLTEATNVTCWIALEDVTRTNGGLSFIPGSHKLNIRKWIELDEPVNLLKFIPKGKKRKPASYSLRAGDATFHNGLTFHFAAPNRSKKPRKGIAIIYLADGSTFNGKEGHWIVTRSRFKAGKPIKGKLNPIIY